MPNAVPATSSADDLLTLQDAVALRYAGYSTLRRYIADGRLTASRVGGRIKIRRGDLEALLEPARPEPVRVLSPEVRLWVDKTLAAAPPLAPAEAATVARLIVKAGVVA